MNEDMHIYDHEQYDDDDAYYDDCNGFHDICGCVHAVGCAILSAGALSSMLRQSPVDCRGS